MTDIVAIHYTGYFNEEFIDECVRDAHQAAMIEQALGEPVTPLQKLAYCVLKQNGYFQERMNDD